MCQNRHRWSLMIRIFWHFYRKIAQDQDILTFLRVLCTSIWLKYQQIELFYRKIVDDQDILTSHDQDILTFRLVLCHVLWPKYQQIERIWRLNSKKTKGKKALHGKTVAVIEQTEHFKPSQGEFTRNGQLDTDWTEFARCLNNFEKQSWQLVFKSVLFYYSDEQPIEHQCHFCLTMPFHLWSNVGLHFLVVGCFHQNIYVSLVRLWGLNHLKGILNIRVIFVLLQASEHTRHKLRSSPHL